MIQELLIYRAIGLDSKKWELGFIYEHLPPPQAFPSSEQEKSKFFIIRSGFCDWNMERPMDKIPVNGNTIGYYTGKKDVKKKRIFTGDIIRRSSGYVFEVKVREYHLGLINQSKAYGFDYQPDDEVIGNVHENPELLTNKY